MTNYKPPPPSNKDTFDISWITKDTRCWVFIPNTNENDIYVRAVIKGIVPLSVNKGNSRVSGLTQNGASFQAKAHQLDRCRDSNSIERDLIEMDIINAPQVLMQLKRRLAQHKIHTCLWNSLIIVNPFKFVAQQYSQKTLSSYFEHIFMRGQDIRKHQPHIFSFMFQILQGMQKSDRIQVISISGQSGSGKTETNKQALRAISYCSSRVLNIQHQKSSNMQTRILKGDPILQVFGNAKTIKNDNSSRFGKLITLKVNGQTMRIYNSTIKNYFLEKSRIISQSAGERNFHIFYQFVSFLSEQQRGLYRMKSSHGHVYRVDDFHYLSANGHSDKGMGVNDKQMWDDLNQSLISLQFPKSIINEIWSIIAGVLLIGNIKFDSSSKSDNDPCEIKNTQIADSVAFLLGVDKKQFYQSLVSYRRTIAGEVMLSALGEKQCYEGRDSMAKALYESLFLWLIEQINRRMNVGESIEKNIKHIKLLDIYGFEVFQHNSFEQLCVNYTNEKIHQIYLEQVFIHEKNTLRKEGLQGIISKLNFTDNIKIIELLDTLNKSVFNLLDESCSVNVRDDDFLSNVRKIHDQHEHFPPSNNVNLRKSFIIKHTPGQIEYMAQGFRQKNKDLIREDIVNKLSRSKLSILMISFKQRLQAMKGEVNKRFLGIKIRKQVKQLILEMSNNTDLHFIRCIKPNENKKSFHFVDMVCFNQIKYLGILDTVQMRRESYHIRQHYSKFYYKYGILEKNISNLIAISENKLTQEACKQLSMNFITKKLVNYSLDYQFGRQKIFLKMSSQNVLDTLLRNQTKNIDNAATAIKVHYKRSKMAKRRLQLKVYTKMVQRAIRSYLKVARKLRTKQAVRKIQNAWIKYHQVFFARKKRPAIMILQKYFRTQKNRILQGNKIEAIRRCKHLLRSLGQSNKLQRQIELFKQMKLLMLGDIYDQIWYRICKYYRANLVKYLRANVVITKNEKLIEGAEQKALYRLNMKNRGLLERYIRSFYDYSRYAQKMKAIINIQSCFRMFKVRWKYNSLRKLVIKIQRNWRKYYYDKQFTIRYTKNEFNKANQEYSIVNETRYWNSLLYRDVNQSSKSKQRGVEKILYGNSRVKQDKIGLFYYLLDFQIVTPLDNIYPYGSWIQNYISLYEQAWQKGNPIQKVEISDQHTICATLNRVYTWGDYNLEDLMSQDSDRFKIVKPISIPSGKLQKIYAHNKFTVIQIQNLDPVVVGDQRLYTQDSSSREWKTINQSYVIINGAVLTLKRIQFSRVPIQQKIVQLSCGMQHCIAKTSLKKLYTWGNNSHGQLGIGHYRRVKKPKIINYFKYGFSIQQVSASACGSMALDSSGRMYWWGSNGTITKQPTPCEVLLFEKSEFLDNPQKYSIVRILPSWSKSLSIIGLTISSHEGIFKTSQNNVRIKTYENLMVKWNQDIHQIFPPYIQSICGYFQERLMPKPKILKQGRNRQLQNQRIRQKLLAQITVMEQAERNLLREQKKF